MITFDYDSLIKQFDNRFYLVLAVVERVKLLKRGVEAKVERRNRDLISVALEEFTEGHLKWTTEDNYDEERLKELARRTEIVERDMDEVFFDEEDFGEEIFDEAFEDLDLERDASKKKGKKAKAAKAADDADDADDDAKEDGDDIVEVKDGEETGDNEEKDA